jgi:hypothetical protein
MTKIPDSWQHDWAPVEVGPLLISDRPHLAVMVQNLHIEELDDLHIEELDDGLDLVFDLDLDEAGRLAQAVIGYLAREAGLPPTHLHEELHHLQRLAEHALSE